MNRIDLHDGVKGAIAAASPDELRRLLAGYVGSTCLLPLSPATVESVALELRNLAGVATLLCETHLEEPIAGSFAAIASALREIAARIELGVALTELDRRDRQMAGERQ